MMVLQERPSPALEFLNETDENMQEVILKNKGDSSQSKLSLVVGDKLFQAISIDSSDYQTRCMHKFAISREAIDGFNHQQFDVLRSWRIPLIVLATFSLIFSSLISYTLTAPFELGLVLFIASIGLLVFSFGNPHKLTFSTRSRSYSVFFFEFGSNHYQLTQMLSAVGKEMASFLVTGEFQAPQINTFNIGRVGNTTATDSVVIEEQGPIHKVRPASEIPPQQHDAAPIVIPSPPTLPEPDSINTEEMTNDVELTDSMMCSSCGIVLLPEWNCCPNCPQ
jgi:hypothetical protein